MKYLLCAVTALLLSCTPTVPVQLPQETTYSRKDPKVDRTEPKISDPVKQKKCSESGKICQGNDHCETVCNDLFSRRNQREDCEKLPRDMVFSFEDLIESVEDGETDDISAKTLECLLDIDDKKFSKAIRKLTRTQAKQFLLLIAEDEEIARILKDEDDEFNILKQIFSKVSGYDLKNVITREIEDDKSFLHLASEGNEYAYQWIDRYVEEQCDNGISEECPSGESISAYCKALVTLNQRDLTDFLADADLFSDIYQNEFDNNNFKYNYKGFEAFCQYAEAGALSTDCPDDEDPDDKFKLAAITFDEIQSGTNGFYDLGHYRAVGSQAAITDSTKKGRSEPRQDILRGIEFGSTTKKVWLDETEINDALSGGEEFDKNADWYIYIGSDNRYALNHNPNDAYSKGRIKYQVFDTTGGALTTGTPPHNVWLAYEDERGNCRYVKP